MLPLPLLIVLSIVLNAPKPQPRRKPPARCVGLDYFLSLPVERVEGMVVHGD
jgi:hypothetical protein